KNSHKKNNHSISITPHYLTHRISQTKTQFSFCKPSRNAPSTHRAERQIRQPPTASRKIPAGCTPALVSLWTWDCAFLRRKSHQRTAKREMRLALQPGAVSKSGKRKIRN